VRAAAPHWMMLPRAGSTTLVCARMDSERWRLASHEWLPRRNCAQLPQDLINIGFNEAPGSGARLAATTGPKPSLWPLNCCARQGPAPVLVIGFSGDGGDALCRCLRYELAALRAMSAA